MIMIQKTTGLSKEASAASPCAQTTSSPAFTLQLAGNQCAQAVNLRPSPKHKRAELPVRLQKRKQVMKGKQWLSKAVIREALIRIGSDKAVLQRLLI